MSSPLRLCLTSFVLLGLVLSTRWAGAAKPKPLPDHWVGTWSTASRPVAPGTPGTPDAAWIPGAADTTLRQVVHTSLPGSLVRFAFTNVFGTEPLTLGEVHVALAEAGGNTTGNISLFSANALTFAGASSVTIPAGAEIVSDPVALTVPAGADLVISLFLPAQKIATVTEHPGSLQDSFVAPGNVVGLHTLTPPPPVPATLAQAAGNRTATPAAIPQVLTNWYFLKSVEVWAPGDTGAVVAFGDSITDGDESTPNMNRRWPDVLAERLRKNPATAKLGMLNAGISGNRVLVEGNGPSALTRFDRDVLSQNGVRYVILLEGINDIGEAYAPTHTGAPTLTAAQLEAALTDLATRAHAHNVKVFAATLTPYEGAEYSSPAGEQVREAYNEWIRSVPNVFDGVIDFATVTASSSSPLRYNPAYDSGDHLHPSDAGYRAMGESVPLALFAGTPAARH